MENENNKAQPNSQNQSQQDKTEAFDANSVSESTRPETPVNEQPKMENAPQPPKKHLISKKLVVITGIIVLILMTASLTFFFIYSVSNKKAQEEENRMKEEANTKMPAEVEEVEEVIVTEVEYEEETYDDPDLEFFINSFEEEDIIEEEADGVEAALDEEESDLIDLETIYDDEDL